MAEDGGYAGDTLKFFLTDYNVIPTTKHRIIMGKKCKCVPVPYRPVHKVNDMVLVVFLMPVIRILIKPGHYLIQACGSAFIFCGSGSNCSS